MEQACVTCLFYRDAGYSRTYATPTCTNSGSAINAMVMRRYVCGVENPTYYEPKKSDEPRKGSHHD